VQPPLAGTTILALTEYGAGPFAGLLLAGLGARIVKLEAPGRGGDSGRAIPPLARDGDSLFFQQANLGSQSICLDLAAPAARPIFERLVARADGLLTNLRPKAIGKLGLTYRALAPLNPRLVVCTLTGFGLDGPLANVPGYDYLFQARYAHMALTGGPSQPPTRSGASLIDMLGSILAALSLVSGLHSAQRTGRGGEIDTSLLEAAGYGLMYFPAWLTGAGFRPERLDWGAHQTVVPCRVFETADGHVIVMCQTEAFWQKLCALLDRPDLLARPEFATIPDRWRHRAALERELEVIFRAQPTAHWLELIGDQVPIGPVNSLEAALADPQFVHQRLLQPVEHPVFQHLQAIMPPFKLDGERPRLGRAPRLGEHTRPLLRDLAGLSEAEIDGLVVDGLAVAE
jgi:crotonobetainyl-CoA:carnitine CoA-transferase CaiB-like acyl-CoA transferase